MQKEHFIVVNHKIFKIKRIFITFFYNTCSLSDTPNFSLENEFSIFKNIFTKRFFILLNKFLKGIKTFFAILKICKNITKS